MTLGFKKYLELESLKKNLVEATGSSEFPDRVFAYLSVASNVSDKETWETTVFSLLKAFKENQPDGKLPLIKDVPKENGKPVSWDYEGRGWAMWSHMIAKTYGWTSDFIAELDVNEAFGYIQEILTDEQLEMEFQYSLSDVAYPYNRSTKKNHFKPLPRPYWMKVAIPPIKKMKFRADFLPVGLVEDVSGMPMEFNPLRDTVVVQKKNQTKETNSPPSP